MSGGRGRPGSGKGKPGNNKADNTTYLRKVAKTKIIQWLAGVK